VAYGQIPRADRAARHRAAAAWVEALGRPEDHAEMVASHYLNALEYARAAGTDDAELAARARPVLRDAGERASALYAWPAAARFYTQALELWPEDDPQRPYVLYRCGVARVSADGSGLELITEAIGELEAAGDAETAARAAVYAARTQWWLHGDARAHDDGLDRALALVGDRPDSPSRVAALAQRAAALNARGLSAQAIDVIDDALPAAERLGLDEVRARLLELRGASHLALGEERGFTDLEQAVGLATEARAFSQLHTALNNRATREVSLGRLEDARRSLAAMQANLENDANIGTRRWVSALSVEMYFMTGEWADAMRLADAFVAEADEGATHILEPSVRMLRAAMLSAGGEAVKASREIEAALAQIRQTNDAEGGQTGARAAFGLLAEGRSEEASELLSGVLELGERMIPVLNDSPIIDGAWAAHDLGRGEEYLTCIEQFGRTGAWAEVAAAISVGDFLAAAETCREIGYRPGEAYARLRMARELVEEGRRAEADAELQRALGFWREVGATRYVREGEALLAASA
jgi:hypothetical protein